MILSIFPEINSYQLEKKTPKPKPK